MSLLKARIEKVKEDSIKYINLIIDSYIDAAVEASASDHNFGQTDFTFRVGMEELPEIWDALSRLVAIFSVKELSERIGIIVTYNDDDFLVNYSGE